ncbi:MAG: hypothetical protein IPN95_31305 [Bacteroidetes bacterium]|nr:hypothetical protein [Bacteroidota bacterium]
MHLKFTDLLLLSFMVSFLLLLLALLIHPQEKRWMLAVTPENWHLYHGNVLNRAKFAFAPLHFRQIYPPVTPFALGVVLAFFLVLLDRSILNAMLNFSLILLGATLAFGAAWFVFLRNYLKLYRLVLVQEAARDLAKFGNKDEAMAFFDAAATNESLRVREGALMGYGVLGTAAVIPKVEKMGQDPNPSLAKDAREAHQILLEMHNLGKPLSVAPIDKLIERIVYVRNQLSKKSEYKLRVNYDAKLEDALNKMNDIVRSQFPLARAYPFLYCVQCMAHAEKLTFFTQEWVRCHRCQDVFGLITEVRQVIGQIGGVRDWELKDGILKVSLWDADKGVARGAEVEWIEIIAGQPFDYDWAVSAVVEKMHHFHPRADYSLPVKFIGDIVLQTNTKHVLASLEQNL